MQDIIIDDEMKLARSMHKQSCFYDKLFISGGSILDDDDNLVVATNKCEIIRFDKNLKPFKWFTDNMEDERRNHGQCKIIREKLQYVLVGLGEDNSRVDNNKFEIYNMQDK